MERSLTEIWQERASTNWRRDFDDYNKEMSGVQVSRIRRFTTGNGPVATAHQDKADTDGNLMQGWLDYTSASYQRAFHQLMGTAAATKAFYDDTGKELDGMKAQLGAIKERYEKRTIRLNDGRRVYVDENGKYAYQDQYGAWNDLEAGALDEARAKHKALGDTAITKDQKIELDEYEAEILYTEAMIEDNRQRIDRYTEAANNREMSEEKLDAAKEQIEKDRAEVEDKFERVLNKQRHVMQVIEPETETTKTELNDDLANDIFGADNKTPPIPPRDGPGLT